MISTQNSTSAASLASSRQSSSSLDMESISFDTLGSDLSLDESIRRIRDLTRENQNLRESVGQSNEIMKKQCTVLTDWRDKWEQEREQMRSRHEQAKTVVTELRSNLQASEKEVEDLRQKLSHFKKDESMRDSELELLTLRQHKEKLCEQLTGLRTKTEGQEEFIQKLQSDRDEKCQEIDRYMKLFKEANDRVAQVEGEQRTLQAKTADLLKMYEAEKKKNKPDDKAEDSDSPTDFSLIQLEEAVSGPSTLHGTENVQGLTMSSVLQQLQEERQKVSDLMASFQLKNEELEAFYGKHNELEEKLVKAQQEHQTQLLAKDNEIDGLKNRLSAATSELKTVSKSSLESQCSEEEQRNLKVQVQSLVLELKSANEKAKASADLYSRQKQRIQSLEAQVNQLQNDLESQREKHDKLIHTLQTSIKNLEEELTHSRDLEKPLRERNEDLTRKLNLTSADFQQHLKSCQQNKTDLSLEQKKKYELRIDNLTAQILTAEEAMQEKIQEIKDLSGMLDKIRQENGRLKGDLEDMPILRAQVEVFRTDFDAERAAREREHDAKMEVEEELKQLHQRNQQLQEELENMSSNQMQEMYRRHGAQAQASGDGRPMGIQAQASEQEEEDFQCPKCNCKAPDLDTLQLHCLECIE